MEDAAPTYGFSWKRLRNCVAYGSLVPLKVRSVGGMQERDEGLGGRREGKKREGEETPTFIRGARQGRYSFGAS